MTRHIFLTYALASLWFLVAGCNMNNRPDIWQAIIQEDLAKIEEYKLAGGDMNACQRNGYYNSLLTYAMEESKKESFKKLLELGSDPSVFDKNRSRPGEGPMHRAACNDDSYYLKLLLEFGGDPNLFLERPKNEFYPLGHAISAGNLENVKLLVENGADINQKTYLGWTNLDFALMSCQYEIALWFLVEMETDFSGESTTLALSMSLAKLDMDMYKERPNLFEERAWIVKIASFLESKGIDVRSYNPK